MGHFFAGTKKRDTLSCGSSRSYSACFFWGPARHLHFGTPLAAARKQAQQGHQRLLLCTCTPEGLDRCASAGPPGRMAYPGHAKAALSRRQEPACAHVVRLLWSAWRRPPPRGWAQQGTCAGCLCQPPWRATSAARLHTPLGRTAYPLGSQKLAPLRDGLHAVWGACEEGACCTGRSPHPG
jgi:hypothetical protein